MEGTIQESLFGTIMRGSQHRQIERHLVSQPARGEAGQEEIGARVGECTPDREEQGRWTTKQTLAVCAWSAFFGLGCGYAWLFLHAATNVCQ